mmetsp:Transcript_54028/g.167475  ORF Transcript_54028/g.167475 Transcript_54028/m.167475 type:complete len:211 (+) Transcript_54028:319-951(+)
MLDCVKDVRHVTVYAKRKKRLGDWLKMIIDMGPTKRKLKRTRPRNCRFCSVHFSAITILYNLPVLRDNTSRAGVVNAEFQAMAKGAKAERFLNIIHSRSRCNSMARAALFWQQITHFTRVGSSCAWNWPTWPRSSTTHPRGLRRARTCYARGPSTWRAPWIPWSKAVGATLVSSRCAMWWPTSSTPGSRRRPGPTSPSLVVLKVSTVLMS